MPAHKFRGKEQYNPNIGTDLYIRKLSPGSEDAEGYEVDIYKDKDFVETRKLNSKKKVMELVKEYKTHYDTDRAFMNEMHLFLTHKLRERESGMITDESLFKKAQSIETLLVRLFNPDTPITVKKTAEETQQFPTTEEVLEQVKQKIKDFIAKNPEATGVSSQSDAKPQDESEPQVKQANDTSKAFNAIMSFIYKLKDAIDQENAKGANIDKNKIIQELNKEFGHMQFLQENKKKEASESVTISIAEGDSYDISTDDAIESLIDSLNEISHATKEQLEAAQTISEEAPSQIQLALKDMYAEFEMLNQKTSEFLKYIQTNKFSGYLSDALAGWIIEDKTLSIKQAKILKDFVEIDLDQKTSQVEKLLLKLARYHDTMTKYMKTFSSQLNFSIYDRFDDLQKGTANVNINWDSISDILLEFVNQFTDEQSEFVKTYVYQFIRGSLSNNNEYDYPLLVSQEIPEISTLYTDLVSKQKIQGLVDDFFTEIVKPQIKGMTVSSDDGTQTVEIDKWLDQYDYKKSQVYQSLADAFASILAVGTNYISLQGIIDALDQTEPLNGLDLQVTPDGKYVELVR